MKKTMVMMLALTMAFGTVVSASPAVQQKTPVAITIKAGEFSLANPSIKNFGDVTLLDAAKQYKTSFNEGNFTVKDLRGSQAGWKVNVTASQFSTGDGKTLPVGSLTLTPVKEIVRVGTGSGALPVKSLTETKAIDAGTVEIMKAVPASGMGVFDFNFPTDALTINIDPTTAVSTAQGVNYASTLTWDLVQAP